MRPLAPVVLACALLSTATIAQERRAIVPADASARRTFSPGIMSGDFLHVSGHLGSDPSTRRMPDGIGAQTHQTLANIENVLAAADMDLSHVVRVNVFLTDMSTFREMNEAYLEFFPNDPPARITVGCAGLALGAAVEIDCIAARP